MSLQTLSSEDAQWFVAIGIGGVVFGLYKCNVVYRRLSVTQNYIVSVSLQLALWISWTLYVLTWDLERQATLHLFSIGNLLLFVAVMASNGAKDATNYPQTIRRAEKLSKASHFLFGGALVCIAKNTLTTSPLHYEAGFLIVVLSAICAHGYTGRNVYRLLRALATNLMLVRTRRRRQHCAKKYKTD